MNYSDYRFTLDIQIHQAQVSVPVTFGDTARKLYIGLTDGRKPYTINNGCRAVFVANKPDGTVIFNDCIIEGNTTIIYEFSENTTNCEGIVNCEIRLYDASGKVLTSPQFIIIVDKTVVRDEEVPISEDESTTIKNIIAAEQRRVIAENARVAMENARVYAENERDIADIARDEAENARKAAEEERAEAEALRAVAEEDRVEDEAKRAEAETSRVEAEAKRVEAEGQRDDFIGDLDSAVDELIELQEQLIDGRAEAVAKEEVIAAINETLLIADDLATDDPYKALSAAQGVAIKGLINGLISDKVQMESGWYNGTNKSGSSNPLELTFSFVPKLVVIVYRVYSAYPEYHTAGAGFILPLNGYYVRINRGGDSVQAIGHGGTVNGKAVVSVEGTTMKLCYASGGAYIEDHANIFNAQSSYDSSYGNSVQSAGYGYTYYAFG